LASGLFVAAVFMLRHQGLAVLESDGGLGWRSINTAATMDLERCPCFGSMTEWQVPQNETPNTEHRTSAY